MDLPHLRGGFRYLTLFLLTNSTDTTLDVGDVACEIGFQPTWSNLRAYQGYFHSNDDELNKIWYSGAYTLQTNAVPINTGRWIPALTQGWANNGTLSNGSTVIVDGAKRDRAVWPGDMGIAVPSTFVSIGDLDSVLNALQTMYAHQNSDGSFPEAGPPLLQQGSDTYHMWTMIGTYNYVLYTNDTAFLESHWAQYQFAMEYVYNKVLEPLGLLNVTGTRDWARNQQGGNNTEANMILYRTLTTGASLAEWAGNRSVAATYTSRAETLATNIIKYTYDSGYGAFKDNNTDTSLHPQDANSMALLFGVVSNTSAAASSISERLTDNWTPIGAETPELENNISPFISSFEIQGHLTIGQTARALDLIRRSWGWYLNNPNGTQSTVIEGYLTNGSFGYRNYRGYYYDSSYVSHSHGWSSGPTSALTNYVLGLQVTGPLGGSWKFAPQFGDLTSVEGGFTTALGKFQAAWNVTDGGLGYSAEWTVPANTKGTVVLPSLPRGGSGNVTWNGQHYGHVATACREIRLRYLLTLTPIAFSVMFSANSDLNGNRKDSTVNAETMGEFCWNVATWDLREAVNQTAEWFDPTVDEFQRAGLEKEPAKLLNVPMVKASPIKFECRYYTTLHLPGNPPMGSADVVIGRVVAVHIDEKVLTDGMIDLGKVQPIARCGYHQYTVVRAESIFEMIIPGDPKQLVGLEGNAEKNVGFLANGHDVEPTK
ncbi:hypothetical protein B0A55_02579 [Friedmanniomyces simplex]|uniref:Flavin reductase like domain-containing protein n=1 Tax=Friedmanniomyces simplex TaxID=329884 RepID=A0A4U0XQK5_9PEZI|nr:hypothetical protein B0A55_02579 [Friedmanniomyces simplex]